MAYYDHYNSIFYNDLKYIIIDIVVILYPIDYNINHYISLLDHIIKSFVVRHVTTNLSIDANFDGKLSVITNDKMIRCQDNRVFLYK